MVCANHVHNFNLPEFQVEFPVRTGWHSGNNVVCGKYDVGLIFPVVYRAFIYLCTLWAIYLLGLLNSKMIKIFRVSAGFHRFPSFEYNTEIEICWNPTMPTLSIYTIRRNLDSTGYYKLGFCIICSSSRFMFEFPRNWIYMDNSSFLFFNAQVETPVELKKKVLMLVWF